MQRRFALIGHVHTLSDLTDFSLTGVADNDLLQYNSATANWENVTQASLNAALDHGLLAGLADDDHPQYPLAAGTETIGGSWTFTPWTVFTGGLDAQGGYLQLSHNTAARMYFGLYNSSAGAHNNYWDLNTSSNNLVMNWSAWTDTPTEHVAIGVTRTTGTAAISNIQYGNSTDEPTHKFYGDIEGYDGTTRTLLLDTNDLSTGSYGYLYGQDWCEWGVQIQGAVAYGGGFGFKKSRGTLVTPSAALSGDALGEIYYGAYGTSTWIYPVSIGFILTANATTTAPGYLNFGVADTSAPASKLRLYTTGEAWWGTDVYQTFDEMTAPGTPSSGRVALYAKSDGLLYSKDDAGTETLVSGGVGGGGSGTPGTGAVNDGVMVYRGASAQTLTTATHTTITFDTEERDDGSYANLGTNNDRITITNPGWYLVQGTCGFSTSSAGYRSAYFMVNGDTNQRHGQFTLSPAGSTLNAVLTPSALLYLAAGDYVQMRGYQDSGGDLTVPVSTTQKNPRLSVHRLTGYSGAANPVSDGAVVYRAATVQTLANNTPTAVTFDTELLDYNSYFTTGANSRFTIANSGWYVLTGTVRFAANATGARVLYWIKNGDTNDRYGQEIAAALGGSVEQVMTSTYVAYLTAGDYVQLYANQTSGGNLDLTLYTTGGEDAGQPRMAIHRLGTATPTPAQRYDRMWDFDTMFVIPSTTALTGDEWSYTQTGGSVTLVDGSADHPGVVRFSSGTTASGVASIQQALTGATTQRTYFLDSVPLVIEALVNIGTLPTTTNNFAFSIGLRSSNAYADRAQITCSYSGSAKIYGVTTASSTTTTGTGTTTATTGWQHWRLICTTSSVKAYLNGTLMDTITTNIPTVGMHLFAIIAYTAGAARTVDLDFIRVYKDFTTPRYTA